MTKIDFKPKGRLAHVTLEDFLTGKLGLAQHDGDEQSNPIFHQCRDLCDPPRKNHPRNHELLLIPSQGYDGTNDPSGNGNTLLSFMCGHCRYHFVFAISHGFCGTEAAKEFPLHHYVIKSVKSFDAPPEDDARYEEYKTYPLVSQVQMECSVCQQLVTIEMTTPRLKSEWFKMLTDIDRVRRQMKVGRESDPDRFANLDEDRMANVLVTLNAYLRDLLKTPDGTPPRKISFRNKTFFVQFGPDSHHIFTYLGFRETIDGNDHEQKWVLPELSAQAAVTPLRSTRAFIEDARAEVQNVLYENKPPKTDDTTEFVPRAGLGELEKALACDKYHRRGRLADGIHGDNPRVLGALNSDSSLYRYAYERQKTADPTNRKVYLEALKQIAVGSNMMDLQIFVAEESSIEDAPDYSREGAAPRNVVEAAYRHFGLDAATATLDDNSIIGTYRNYRSESAQQSSLHRTKLFDIGRVRESEPILAVSLEPMDITEACAILDAAADWPVDSILQVAQVKEVKYAPLTCRALEALAREQVSDVPAREAVNDAIAMIKTKAEFESIEDASALKTNGADGSSNMARNKDMPPGLSNLRNTCYLNSILQYFYSIKAVREFVLETDFEPIQPPTQEGVNDLLSREGQLTSDGEPLAPGRAFVGIEFAIELQNLFRTLQQATGNSVRPKQRLANAALCKPLAEAARSNAAAKEAPPLPPRDNKPPTSEGINEPQVTVDVVSDTVETASNMSCQTLVDPPGDESTYVVINADADNNPSEAMDTEMKDLQDDAVNFEPHRDSAVDVADEPAKDMSSAVDSKTSETSASKATSNLRSVEELKIELDKDNVGSDQMDVDEVMINTLDHLEAAWAVSKLGHSSHQPNPIQVAFYSTLIEKKKARTDFIWDRKGRRERSTKANPPPVTKTMCSLYEAMGRHLDRTVVDDGKLAFTSIDQAAPHFLIQILRADWNEEKKEVEKLLGGIKIEETLYLDRYMDGADNTSPIYKARKRAWDIKDRLEEIGPASQVGEDGPSQDGLSSSRPLPVSQLESFSLARSPELDIEGIYQRYPTLKRSADGDIGGRAKSPKRTANDTPLKAPIADMGDTPMTDSKSALDEMLERFEEDLSEQRKSLESERAALFENMKKHKYRLHAVICHLGSGAVSGHYWVWIHDFEKKKWRKYNDDEVTECDEDTFSRKLEGNDPDPIKPSQPYYLAYLREEEVTDLQSRLSSRKPFVDDLKDTEMTERPSVELVEDVAGDVVCFEDA